MAREHRPDRPKLPRSTVRFVSVVALVTFRETQSDRKVDPVSRQSRVALAKRPPSSVLPTNRPTRHRRSAACDALDLLFRLRWACVHRAVRRLLRRRRFPASRRSAQGLLMLRGTYRLILFMVPTTPISFVKLMMTKPRTPSLARSPIVPRA